MRIVIAGGGTGGHLFPGIAIAEEFLKRDEKNKVVFIGTKKGIESRLLDKFGYELKIIDVEGVKGRGVKALIKGAYQIPKSLWQSVRILKQFGPDIVFGVGGYASGPAVLAAYFMNISTAIAEQNATPGVTNRILGNFVDKIFVTYAQTQKCFSQKKVVLSGNPVRASFAVEQVQTKEKKDYRQLLVFGGSQGAAAINKSVVGMLPQLQSMKGKVRILHQTGMQQMEEVKKSYQQSGMEAVVTDFIIDMSDAYAQSDLIVCRAGATSLAEITAAGKAAVLIPYPWAANDHQLKNALAMSNAGAAVVITEKELSGEKLFGVIDNILRDEAKLRRLEENSAKLGKVEAAATIVDNCIKLVAEKN
ncbi:MAG: undecaprenyldiphospho-muramoylpentapeptide beta-N-acetylglucosaminyltransferase [Smithella sp.]|jgi:UDP-N-acetylglucosamine--N-acetylmuramyl-(pentapeptide) pyrophosphoryl-undecaprenol N-acetylglucosamine transferase